MSLSHTLPLPKVKDQVFVENKEVLDSLISSLPIQSKYYHSLPSPTSTTRNKHGNNGETGLVQSYSSGGSKHTYDKIHSIISADSNTTSMSMQQDLLKEQVYLQRQKILNDTQKNVEKTLLKNAQKKVIKMARLEKDLEECQAFIESEIDGMLSNDEETKQNKRRHQYEEWNKSVFGEIQVRLLDRVNTLNSRQLNHTKNQDYQKYLNITNRKAAIFRDTIIEGEYDPLEVNRRSIHIKMPILKDPTNIYTQKKTMELAILDIDHLLDMKKPVYCKYTLPTHLWLAGKIESTPYGLARARTNIGVSAINSARHKSKVEFDHFDYPIGAASVDAERPRGKRAGAENFFS